MASIFERLWHKFSRRQTGSDEDRDTVSPAGKRASDEQAGGKPGEPASESGLSGSGGGSPENGAAPDLYEDTGCTVPQLRALSESEPDIDESPGFNPYDTGALHNKDKKS